MKNILSIILLISVSLNTNAQNWFGKKIKGNGHIETVTRNVDNFKELSVAGAFQVELIASDKNQLIIDIEDNLTEYLETKVKGKELLIRWERYYNVKPKKKVNITLYYKEIKSVELAGSGSIRSEEPIETNSLEIDLAGSGMIAIAVQAEDVEASLAGSGVIELKGETDSFDISKAGSGDLKAYAFKCQDIDISAAGSGVAEVYASESIHASLAGSGNIYYKGNPRIVKPDVAGSGSVIMK